MGYGDVSAAKYSGNYGLGHRGYNDLYSAKSVAPMEDSKSKYGDVSSAKSAISSGLGHRGHRDSAKASVSTVDDADAEEKENYKRLIRKQLDEENEDETDAEMDANVKVVMQLAREAAAKKR